MLVCSPLMRVVSTPVTAWNGHRWVPLGRGKDAEGEDEKELEDRDIAENPDKGTLAGVCVAISLLLDFDW